jgi:hypothetical protein
MELTFEQKLQIQKLDMQIAALPIDKQQQFARGQRELVPKYLAKNAASGLNTTTTLTVVGFFFLFLDLNKLKSKRPKNLFVQIQSEIYVSGLNEGILIRELVCTHDERTKG